MLEVVLNDRLGKKVRVKCNEDDTIGDLKKLAAAQLGTRPEKLKIQKWYTVYKGMCLCLCVCVCLFVCSSRYSLELYGVPFFDDRGNTPFLMLSLPVFHCTFRFLKLSQKTTSH